MEKENSPAKESGTTRLPEELRAELRKAQARYGSKGVAPPTFGALLLEAWRFYAEAQKNASRPEPITAGDDSHSAAGTGLDRTKVWLEDIPNVSQLIELIGDVQSKAQQVLTGLRDLGRMMVVLEGGSGERRQSTDEPAHGGDPDIEREVEETLRAAEEARERDSKRGRQGGKTGTR